MNSGALFFVFFLVFASQASAQKFYTYLLDLGPHTVELAWGTTNGENTIGRSSPSHGPAIIKIAGRTLESNLNYIVVGDLEPDTAYTYEISIGKTRVGGGEFRTWPEQSNKLAFLLLGDFGTGRPPQYQIAQAMWQEFQRRQNSDNPIRFMLSVGDNIYGNITSVFFGVGHTGASDEDWGPKFFAPYEPLIARIPFFGVLGNHDGNETESHRDMAAFLDNFPFPGDKPNRYYDFTYAGLAEFFGLDSTRNTPSGPAHPSYLEDSPEFQWMKREFSAPKAMWLIPFFHHPMFTAGPFHAPSLDDLRHWFNLFVASGVKVVFTGHEHNFQVSDVDAATGGMRFFVSGAGGELRTGNLTHRMKAAHIAAWAQQNDFLLVEIEGKTMKVTPLSYERLDIQGPDGQQVQAPFTVTLP